MGASGSITPRSFEAMRTEYENNRNLPDEEIFSRMKSFYDANKFMEGLAETTSDESTFKEDEERVRECSEAELDQLPLPTAGMTSIGSTPPHPVESTISSSSTDGSTSPRCSPGETSESVSQNSPQPTAENIECQKSPRMTIDTEITKEQDITVPPSTILTPLD